MNLHVVTIAIFQQHIRMYISLLPKITEGVRHSPNNETTCIVLLSTSISHELAIPSNNLFRYAANV